MITDEVVIISDDKEKDSDIEVIDITKENSTELKSSNNDAILIDGDAQQENDVIEVIDIDRETNDRVVKEYLNKVCSENRIVGEFIEKCLDLENSTGMLRVIHRTFLPLYFKMDDAHRESDDFKRLLDFKMRALEINPNRKFSHLKSVCEIMKSFHKDRKKVNFVTLTKEVKAKPSQRKPTKPKKRKRSQLRNNVYKKAKRKPENIIELDDTDDSQTITNNTRISENSLAESEDIVVLEDDVDPPNNSNKENNNQSHNSSTQQVSNSEFTTNQFLVPQRSEEFMMNEKKAMQIKYLEKEIEQLKKTIDELEEQEVDFDSLNSPYVVCEEMKAKIVKLYKELCTLTGSEAIKKREVRLTETEGRAHLPVKILEEFINDNIGSDGNPHFPDFTEVVRCVSKANMQAKLGWSQARIMAEARNLFTYCGQALQANRKKREWKYLLSRVNSKLDEDPAENDPALMQRLEVNRRIAVKKESDLLEKYVEMEQICNSRINLSFDEDSDNTELMNQITNQEITAQSFHNFNISTSVNYENGNNHKRTEVSSSETVVYGSHQSKSNKQTHEMENISDAYKMIQEKSNIENENTRQMLEVPKFIEISVPAIDNVIDTIKNEKQIDLPSAVEIKQNDKTMIEVCIENHKPPEVKVINLFSQPLEKDENRIQTAINEVSKGEKTEYVLGGNTNEDDSTIAKGNIVIKDVYSIATKQEITSFQNNDGDLEKCDTGGTFIEKSIQQTINNYTNPEESTEKCENIGVQEVDHITTANNVTTSNEKPEKSDVVNDDLIQSVKVESSEVLKHMQMFGDSFTATIFDIEDPFLVIEISDSSDDSDCEES